MSSLSRELVFLILQFLDEEKYKETVHRLEKESGFFFNMKYFEEAVTNGDWDEVENYLTGFTKVEDNRYSMKVFFEIRKQKYLEALDKRDNAKAVDILVKDLKVFSTFNDELYKEITMLLTLTNFRENEQLAKYGDTKTARGIMFVELKKLIEANPLLRDKLQYPPLKNARLRTLINQSLNWQHQLCKNPRQNPDIKTLFVDHSCVGQPNGARAPSPVPNPMIGGPIAKVGGLPPLGAYGPFQTAPAALTASLAGWMPTQSSMPQVPTGSLGLGAPSNAASMMKRPRSPANSMMDYQTADSEHVMKRSRHFGMSEEVPLPLQYTSQSHARALQTHDELPRTLVAHLNQGSSVKSMDFHPVKHTLLLVGTNSGDITIWDLGGREKIHVRNFKVWQLGSCSVILQASLANEVAASANRVVWSPDGTLFGVAYSKHLVHLYTFNMANDELRDHIEIEAHVGNVSDLAFSHPDSKLSLVTCGEDKTVKVWDVINGGKMYVFEGHEAPVYSVCPHIKQNITFTFSTAVDGKIKAWLYDTVGPRLDYDAPGNSCIAMAYSADGTRLFSCGTNKEGESFLVEWNESEGSVRRTYYGLGKRGGSIVQFDTAKNQFLAAGDEFSIKFWDMDNTNLLTTIDAEGGLMASPCVRFSKDGTLLAASTSDGGIKLLGNVDGVRLIRSLASATNVKVSMAGTFSASTSAPGASIGVAADRNTTMTPVVGFNGDVPSLQDVKPRVNEEPEKSRAAKVTEINEQSQLRCLRLPDNLLPVRIMRLIYTNSGGCILALQYNAVHKLWKWQKLDRSPTGKATSVVPPQLWQPSSGILMTNDISETNVEDAVPCFALSKNDSYVMSASGGKISLFNMMTFKTMTTFMPPPPAATFLAFHPQDNNIIAIGMDDATIHIYNVRVDEVKSKLKGHQKRITGLAFSSVLNVLVSSGADAQLYVWGSDRWEKQTNKMLQIPAGRSLSPLAHTRVQFHQDQIHLLAVHETQLAIYEAPRLECLKQWFPREAVTITDATYSCDSQTIYAALGDGSVGILGASNLRLRCRINPNAYLPPSPKSHAVVIASHPSEPNQFALGLNDGAVHVLEPLESEGKWGTAPPTENGTATSITAAAASITDQQTR